VLEREDSVKRSDMTARQAQGRMEKWADGREEDDGGDPGAELMWWERGNLVGGLGVLKGRRGRAHASGWQQGGRWWGRASGCEVGGGELGEGAAPGREASGGGASLNWRPAVTMVAGAA
jgi:hypothetical protein